MLVWDGSVIDGLRRRHWLHGDGRALKHVGIALFDILLRDVPCRGSPVRLRDAAVEGIFLCLVFGLGLLLEALDGVKHVG